MGRYDDFRATCFDVGPHLFSLAADKDHHTKVKPRALPLKRQAQLIPISGTSDYRELHEDTVAFKNVTIAPSDLRKYITVVRG